jgi:hypothetical protein
VLFRFTERTLGGIWGISRMANESNSPQIELR